MTRRCIFLMICSMKSHCSWVMTLSLENSPARDRNSPPSKVTVYTAKRDIGQFTTTNVKPYPCVEGTVYMESLNINNSSTSKLTTAQARCDQWLHNLRYFINMPLQSWLISNDPSDDSERKDTTEAEMKLRYAVPQFHMTNNYAAPPTPRPTTF